jgi:hypothetical protein
MPLTPRHLTLLLAATLLASGLGGCASINEKVTNGVVDSIPQWAGGMPSDVPPRRGTPEYDAYMQERERKRLEPAVAADGAKPGSPSSPASAPNASALTLESAH